MSTKKHQPFEYDPKHQFQYMRTDEINRVLIHWFKFDGKEYNITLSDTSTLTEGEQLAYELTQLWDKIANNQLDVVYELQKELS